MGCQFVEELRFISASSPPPRLRQQHQQLLTKFHFHITPVIHLPLFSILRLNTPKPNPNVILCAHRVSILSITKLPSISTYVSLIGSGEGRHTTHLLKCILLLSTSQTDWKQSSDVLSDISFDILSDISSDILSDISFDISSDILSDILSDISFDILSAISSDILSDISFDMLSDISSDIPKPKPNIYSFTKKNSSANSIFTSHHAAKVISMTTLCVSNVIALSASDRPARRQLSPKMQNACSSTHTRHMHQTAPPKSSWVQEMQSWQWRRNYISWRVQTMKPGACHCGSFTSSV